MTPERRFVPVVLGLALALASLELAACAILSGPPNPHQQAEGESLNQADASASDASEEPQ